MGSDVRVRARLPQLPPVPDRPVHLGDRHVDDVHDDVVAHPHAADRERRCAGDQRGARLRPCLAAGPLGWRPCRSVRQAADPDVHAGHRRHHLAHPGDDRVHRRRLAVDGLRALARLRDRDVARQPRPAELLRGDGGGGHADERGQPEQRRLHRSADHRPCCRRDPDRNRRDGPLFPDRRDLLPRGGDGLARDAHRRDAPATSVDARARASRRRVALRLGDRRAPSAVGRDGDRVHVRVRVAGARAAAGEPHLPRGSSCVRPALGRCRARVIHRSDPGREPKFSTLDARPRCLARRGRCDDGARLGGPNAPGRDRADGPDRVLRDVVHDHGQHDASARGQAAGAGSRHGALRGGLLGFDADRGAAGRLARRDPRCASDVPRRRRARRRGRRGGPVEPDRLAGRP